MGGQTNTTGQLTNQQTNQFQNNTQNQSTNQQQATTQNQAQNTAQTATLTPYEQAASGLNSILGTASAINPNLSPVQTSAIQALTRQGAAGDPFLSGINATANQLLSGGGANNYAPMINNAYQAYQQQLAPYTNPAYLNPMGTPGFGDAMAATNANITNQINSQFAAAGRDMSGMNQQDLARGLSQGEGQLISNQYNQNVAAQQAAINALYGAGNTTANNLTALQQTGLGNQQAGIGAATSANTAAQYGPSLELQAQSLITGIPLQTLQAQSGIIAPTAATFGTQAGTGTATGTTMGTGTSTGNMYGTSSGTSGGQMTGQTQNTSPLWQSLAGGILGTGSMVGGNTGLLKALGLG